MNPRHLDDRDERVSKYFVPVPQPPNYVMPAILTGAGAVLIIVAIIAVASGSQGSGACLGLVLFIAGTVAGFRGLRNLYGRYSAYTVAKALSEPRATDEEMNEYLSEGIDMAIANAGRTLKYNPAESTIRRGENLLVFTGFPEATSKLDLRFALGDDNLVRASYYEILVVFASSYRFSTYECILEMSSGATVADATKEYHLQDVDGLETASDRVSFPLHRTGLTDPDSPEDAIVEVTSRQLLRLMVSGKPAITMIMGISGKARLRIDNGQLPDFPTPDDMIHRLREYLRDHKQLDRPQHQSLPPSLGGGLALDGPPEPLGM
jgi:hypothetical protein